MVAGLRELDMDWSGVDPNEAMTSILTAFQQPVVGGEGDGVVVEQEGEGEGEGNAGPVMPDDDDAVLTLLQAEGVRGAARLGASSNPPAPHHHLDLDRVRWLLGDALLDQPACLQVSYARSRTM